MQENPRQVFASWVQSLEKAYKDNVEVLNLTCLFRSHARLNWHVCLSLYMASVVAFESHFLPCRSTSVGSWYG